MSAIDLTLHRCTNVRLARTFISNGNSVTLAIEHNGVVTDITMYNLPAEITAKFEQFRDEKTLDFTEADCDPQPNDHSARPVTEVIDLVDALRRMDPEA